MTRKPIELSHLVGHLNSRIALRGGEDRGVRRLPEESRARIHRCILYGSVLSTKRDARINSPPPSHLHQVLTMAESTNTYKWTDVETEKLIKVRMELDSDFTGKRNSAKKAWINVLQRIGLDEKVTPSQISKKWDNLKRKYKELRCPPTGTGTDRGEATAATWPWFSAMHEAIGGRPSIEPPILIDSCDAEVTSCSAVAKDTGLPPSASVEEKDTTSSSPSGTSNMQEEIPCTSSGTPPPKKRRSNRVLDFLEKETEKEEERFSCHSRIHEIYYQ